MILNKTLLLRDAWQHSQALAANEYTSEELVLASLKEVKKKNKSIGAFLSYDEEKILEQARFSDLRRKKNQTLSRYDGIPIGIKDNISEREEPCTCGSQMLANYVAPYSATVIDRLVDSGLVLFGRCNMDEFAMGSSNENSSFYEVKNPWNEMYVPGGSSGGAAAAVASSMVPWALGSDTGGSVRQPAGFCGITGMRPTYGRVSRYGLVAYASTLDQIGPLAKTARDNAVLLSLIEGRDGKDLTLQHGYKEIQISDFQGTKIDFSKIKIGHLLMSGLSKDAQINYAPEVVEAEQKMLEVLKGLGCQIMTIYSDYHAASIALYYIIATAEAASNLARYDGIHYGWRNPRAQSLQEIYTMSRQEGFGSEVCRRILLGNFVLSAGYYDQYYKKAKSLRKLLVNEYNQFFSQVDFIMTPTSPFLPFRFKEKLNPLAMYMADYLTVPPSLAGIPAINTWGGFNSQHLPIGIQFSAPQFYDHQLLLFTHQLEQQFRAQYSLDYSLVGSDAS